MDNIQHRKMREKWDPVTRAKLLNSEPFSVTVKKPLKLIWKKMNKKEETQILDIELRQKSMKSIILLESPKGPRKY